MPSITENLPERYMPESPSSEISKAVIESNLNIRRHNKATETFDRLLEGKITCCRDEDDDLAFSFDMKASEESNLIISSIADAIAGVLTQKNGIVCGANFHYSSSIIFFSKNDSEVNLNDVLQMITDNQDEIRHNIRCNVHKDMGTHGQYIN